MAFPLRGSPAASSKSPISSSGSIKNRRGYLDSQFLCCPPQMSLQNLTQHSCERENSAGWVPCRQMYHRLSTAYLHLVKSWKPPLCCRVAHGYLTPRSDINLDQFEDTRFKFVAFLHLIDSVVPFHNMGIGPNLCQLTNLLNLSHSLRITDNNPI